GLTDHKIHSEYHERVGFVVRRLLPPEPVNSTREFPEFDPLSWDEYALVAGAAAPGWRKITKSGGGGFTNLVPGEEQLPLFPVHYTEDDGRKRRILAGVVPVGKREAYMGAARSVEPDPQNPVNGTRPKSARVVLFRTQVAEPWKSLIDCADSVRRRIKYPVGEEDAPTVETFSKLTQETIKVTREQIQVVSWCILLDFAKYLQKYLGKLWEVVLDPGKDEVDLENDAEKHLFRALCSPDPGQDFKRQLTKDTRYFINDVKSSLRDALQAIGDPKVDLENLPDSVIDIYDRNKPNPNWPQFLFPLADPVLNIEVLKTSDLFEPLGANDEVDSEVVASSEPSPNDFLARVDKLVVLVARAL